MIDTQSQAFKESVLKTTRLTEDILIFLVSKVNIKDDFPCVMAALQVVMDEITVVKFGNAEQVKVIPAMREVKIFDEIIQEMSMDEKRH